MLERPPLWVQSSVPYFTLVDVGDGFAFDYLRVRSGYYTSGESGSRKQYNFVQDYYTAAARAMSRNSSSLLITIIYLLTGIVRHEGGNNI